MDLSGIPIIPGTLAGTPAGMIRGIAIATTTGDGVGTTQAGIIAGGMDPACGVGTIGDRVPGLVCTTVAGMVGIIT